MLRHMVMVKFKERDNIPEIATNFKNKLLALTEKIDALKKMEVGLNINTKSTAFDLVLISDFDDEEGLNIYRTHPEHVSVLEFMRNVVDKTAVVDYII